MHDHKVTSNELCFHKQNAIPPSPPPPFFLFNVRKYKLYTSRCFGQRFRNWNPLELWIIYVINNLTSSTNKKKTTLEVSGNQIKYSTSKESCIGIVITHYLLCTAKGPNSDTRLWFYNNSKLAFQIYKSQHIPVDIKQHFLSYLSGLSQKKTCAIWFTSFIELLDLSTAL